MVKTLGFAMLLACVAAAAASTEHGDSRSLRGAAAADAAMAHYPHIHVASMEARMKARAAVQQQRMPAMVMAAQHSANNAMDGWGDEDDEWSESDYESVMEAQQRHRGRGHNKGEGHPRGERPAPNDENTPTGKKPKGKKGHKRGKRGMHPHPNRGKRMKKETAPADQGTTSGTAVQTDQGTTTGIAVQTDEGTATGTAVQTDQGTLGGAATGLTTTDTTIISLMEAQAAHGG